MEAVSRRGQQISEEMIDSTLADSFPASDPPPWTLGREREPGALITESRRTDNKKRFNLSRNIDSAEKQRAGVVKILNTLSPMNIISSPKHGAIIGTSPDRSCATCTSYLRSNISSSVKSSIRLRNASALLMDGHSAQ